MISLVEQFLEFSVKDTGPGIPAESLEKIFDRFYQVEESLKSEGGGTGIGLSLTRDMVKLLHGDISGRKCTRKRQRLYSITSVG